MTVSHPSAMVTAALYGNEMIIFGGYDNNGFTLNDMYALTLTANAQYSYTWRKISYSQIGSSDEDKAIFNKGFLQHTMCMGANDAGDMCLFVHGRLNENKHVNSDTWEFNLITNVKFVLIGGQNTTLKCSFDDILTFDLQTRVWKRSETYTQLVEQLHEVVQLLSDDVIMNTLGFLSHNDVNNMIAVSKNWKVSRVAKRMFCWVVFLCSCIVLFAYNWLFFWFFARFTHF